LNIKDLETALETVADDAANWDQVCEVVTELLGATGTILPASNPRFRGLWTSGTKKIKEALVEYLEKDWITGDPREPVLNKMLADGICTDDQIYPDRRSRYEMPIYREFLLPWNFGNVCMVRILTPEGYWPMTIHFANDHPPLGDKDIAVIKKIQTLFEAATKRASLLAHEQIFEFSKFFSGSKSEVFLFDADGEYSFALGRNGKISVQEKLDTLIPSDLGEVLKEDLKAIMLSDPGLSLSEAFRFEHKGKDQNILIVQIPPHLRHFFMKFKTCAIRTELKDTTELRNAKMRDDYGLTQSEVVTVEMLSNGKSTNDIAALLGLKSSSIRQRLKSIFNKAEVSGQVELIAKYLSI